MKGIVQGLVCAVYRHFVSLRTFGVIMTNVHAFSTKLANHQIRHQANIKWAVSLVIACGHSGDVCVGMYGNGGIDHCGG